MPFQYRSAIVRGGMVRKALRRSMSAIGGRARLRAELIGERPAIFDPLGVRVTRRTFTPRRVVRGTRMLTR